MFTAFTTFVSCTEDDIDTQTPDEEVDPNEDPNEDPNDDPDDVVTIFTVSSISDYIGSAEGDSATFTLTSTLDWSIAEDDYFVCSPASGTGSESEVTVTVSAKATNETFDEIESTLTITNSDEDTQTVLVIQTSDTVLEFGAMESTEVVSGGETITIPVTSTLTNWYIVSSYEDVDITYDYEASEAYLAVPVNFDFVTREIKLSIFSSSELEGTNTLTIIQASDIYFWQGNDSVEHTVNEDGSLTVSQASIADVRIATKSYLGYGTYTLTVESLNIVDTAANMILQGATADSNMFVTTLSGASGQGSCIYRPDATWRGFYAPAGSYSINGASEFRVELYPTEVGSELIVYIDDAAIISVVPNETYATLPAYVDGGSPIIMGLNARTADAAEFNSITYKSFTFEPYAE